jgi:hypothetical protein
MKFTWTMLRIRGTRTTRSGDEPSRALSISGLQTTDSLTERLMKRIVDSKEYDSMTIRQLTSLQVNIDASNAASLTLLCLLRLFLLVLLVQVVEEIAGTNDE